jgi:hypothetical protein
VFLRLSLSLEAMKAALKIISDLRLHYTRYVGVTGGRLQNLSRRYHDLSMTVVISTEGKKFNYSSRNSGNGKSKIVHIYRYFLFHVSQISTERVARCNKNIVEHSSIAGNFSQGCSKLKCTFIFSSNHSVFCTKYISTGVCTPLGGRVDDGQL